MYKTNAPDSHDASLTFRWQWFLALVGVLFVARIGYLGIVPPLYQSQVVIKSPCLMASVKWSYCVDELAAKALAHRARTHKSRNAILHALALPADYYYVVRARVNETGILLTVTAEDPLLAQAIANEIPVQLKTPTLAGYSAYEIIEPATYSNQVVPFWERFFGNPS